MLGESKVPTFLGHWPLKPVAARVLTVEGKRTTTGIARELGLYGAGQDLLSDAFSGSLRAAGAAKS